MNVDETSTEDTTQQSILNIAPAANSKKQSKPNQRNLENQTEQPKAKSQEQWQQPTLGFRGTSESNITSQ